MPVAADADALAINFHFLESMTVNATTATNAIAMRPTMFSLRPEAPKVLLAWDALLCGAPPPLPPPNKLE